MREAPNSKIDIRQMLIYEDEHLLVVDKPSGLLTIKDDKGGLNLYHELYDYVSAQGRNKKLFVVHRLDRDTSGLLVFAKDIRTKTILQECFEAQAVVRKYEAVTKGNAIPVRESRRIVISIDEDKLHNVNIVPEGRGKRCVTNVTCLYSKNGYSYLDISLVTGRRNQIRLSLNSIGMPIVGDKKYDGEKSSRMKLNAYLLEFPDSLGLSKNKFEIDKIFEDEFVKAERKKDSLDDLLSLI